jgi:glutamyl-tRNA synthetase
MEITHVLRGEDHISNTPKQLLLYDALGWARPQFGHVPLIVGMDRARLSKRHGATRVEAYREMGVLPEALVNFLVLIGWAPSGNSAAANQELFTREELIRYFNPGEIGRSAGAFNAEKLHHFNGLYIRALAPDEYFAQVKTFLPEEWLAVRGEDYAKAVCLLYQEKLITLGEIAPNAWYFFTAPRDAPDGAAAESANGAGEGEEGAPAYGYYNPKAVAKHLIANADAARVLHGLYALLEAQPEARWTPAELEPLVEQVCAETGLGKGKVMQPWRVALTGDAVSPGFFDLLSVFGREEVLRRAKPWVERLEATKL